MAAGKLWFRYARLGVALVFMVLVVGHVGSLRSIFSGFSDLRLPFLVAALALLPLNFFIQFHKWSYLLRPSAPEIASRTVLGSLLVGYTLGLVTPGGIGEVGRSLYIRELETKNGVALVLIDKLSNGLAILIMGLGGLGYLASITQKPFLWTALWLTLGTTIILAAILAVLTRRLDWVQLRMRWAQRKGLPDLVAMLQNLKLWSGKQMMITMAFSLGFHLIFMAQFLFLLRAFAEYAWLPMAAAALVAMSAKALLPISAADLGIREGTAVFFLGMVQVAGVHAFAAAFLLFAINILLPAVIGLGLLPRLSLAKSAPIAQEPRKELTCSNG